MMLTVRAKICIIAVPVGLSFGMRFPAGPSTLGADESGVLTPIFLIACGVISALSLIYSSVFALMTIFREEWFFDWVDMHPPFFVVLVAMEISALIPAGCLAAVSIFP